MWLMAKSAFVFFCGNIIVTVEYSKNFSVST